MVVSLLASLPSLGSVFLFMIFVIQLFSVVFLIFYAGRLHQQCYDNDTGVIFLHLLLSFPLSV
jgi:hypothetical protein